MTTPQQPNGRVHNDLAGVVNGPAILAGSTGDIHLYPPTAAPLVPRQLRAAPPRFTNRHEELRHLERIMAGAATATPLVVLTGPGGVGKSALALHWLHANVDRYPDGQLFVDLGETPDHPMTPGDALAILLRSLGVDDRVLPATTGERQSRYLSLTAGRRIALLIENATTAAQVRPLIPRSTTGVVVVTSRTRPTGLAVDHQPAFVDIGLLDQDAARDLLLAAAGPDRLGDNPADATAVSRLCGRLPLALSIAGARLAVRPRLRLATMIAELADERRRLQALALPDDLSVRAVFDVTYRDLPDPLARLYRLLGQHPGPEFSTDAAAAAAGRPRDETADQLADLADRRILDELDDRYRLHDLHWLHARDQADPPGDHAEQHAAQRRIIIWYLRTALAADRTLMPGRWRVTPTHPDDPVTTRSFADGPAATAWLTEERANLVACVDLAERHGDDTLVWQLCQALWPLFFRQQHLDAWIATHHTGITAAIRCADPLAESKLRSQLGVAHLQVYAGLDREQQTRTDHEAGDRDQLHSRLNQSFADAERQFTAALTAARRCANAEAEATALESLGLTDLYAHRYAEALPWLEQSRDLASAIGDPRRLALLDRHRGRALGGLHRFAEGEAVLGDALHQLRAIEDRYNQARALTDLGELRLRPGAPGDPAEPLRQALDLMTAEDIPHEQARIAELLATVAQNHGDLDAARSYLQQALTWYARLRAPETATVSARLDHLSAPHGPSSPAAGS